MKRNIVIPAFSVLLSFIFCKGILASDMRSNSSRTLEISAGVGLVIEAKNGQYFIKELVKGCPASRSKNIKVGDQIVQIKANAASNWIPVKGLSLKEVINLMQGEVDKPLYLELWYGTAKWVDIMLREKDC